MLVPASSRLGKFIWYSIWARKKKKNTTCVGLGLVLISISIGIAQEDCLITFASALHLYIMARTKQHPSYNGGKAPRMQVLFCFALLHCVTSFLPILELILLTIDHFYFFSSLMHGTSSSWLLKHAVESQCLMKNTLAQLKRSIVTDQEPLPFARSVVTKRVPIY